MITVAHVDEQSGLRGGEQQAAWLVRGLAERGVKNILVGRKDEDFLKMDAGREGIPRIALPLRGELDIYSALRLARLAKSYNVDIFHAHTSHAHGLAVLAVFLGAPSRVLVSRRVNFMPKKHRLNRWKYTRADRILCVSQAVCDTLTDYGLSFPKVITVHSAVDEKRALMTPVSRTSLGIPEDGPLIFSAGSLVDHKDHDNLLKAFVRVRKIWPDALLCIAGDGPLRETLESTCASLHLTPSVFFLGYRKDAPGITRTANVYVSSSWSEGLGTSILEALASGVPVVASEAGGAGEMIIPGRTGYLVPVRNPEALAEGILQSLQNRERAFSMAENGKRHVRETFSVENMVSGTFEAYRELCPQV